MAKHKKKSMDQSILFLKEVDQTLDHSHKSLMEEIQEMQLQINIADAKAMEKQRKKLIKKRMGAIPYYTSKDKVRAREKVLMRMEEKKTLERVDNMFKNFSPCLVIIARLIAALITALLSVEPFVRMISPKTLTRMNTVYKIAMNV